MRSHQQRQKARALKRRSQLNEQRRKLLELHYQDALPMELFRDEQERITRQITETDRELAAAEMKLDRVDAILRRCLDFLVNCYQTYVMASPKVRRQLNQAMFEAFYVGTDGARGHEKVPAGGQVRSPLVANKSPRAWPTRVPAPH